MCSEKSSIIITHTYDSVLEHLSELLSNNLKCNKYSLSTWSGTARFVIKWLCLPCTATIGLVRRTYCVQSEVPGVTKIFVHADETFMEEIWISGKSGRRSDANREKNSSDSA